jgi:hypothetical protein
MNRICGASFSADGEMTILVTGFDDLLNQLSVAFGDVAVQADSSGDTLIKSRSVVSLLLVYNFLQARSTADDLWKQYIMPFTLPFGVIVDLVSMDVLLELVSASNTPETQTVLEFVIAVKKQRILHRMYVGEESAGRSENELPF